MRLINARTLQLEEYFGNSIPEYYILSHRWTNDELTYKDFVKGRRKDSLGYKKVTAFCEFVLRFGKRDTVCVTGNVVKPFLSLRPRQSSRSGLGSDRSPAPQKDTYVWVDTCCIDKRSSAELSEAINSMYAYYKNSMICFAHLADVNRDLGIKDGGEQSRSAYDAILATQFSRSSWFTRGWTLQELLAPKRVIFIDCQWRILGRKWQSLSRHDWDPPGVPDVDDQIAHITGIETGYLNGRTSIQGACIAQRMSWASARVTTRIEDAAYSLLGIFDLNMPLLYGEGGRAFTRLQQELIRHSTDQSIFAWSAQGLLFTCRDTEFGTTGILAPAPICYKHCGSMSPYRGVGGSYAITNAGLELQASVKSTDLHVPAPIDSGIGFKILVASLDCMDRAKNAYQPVVIALLPRAKTWDGAIRASRLHPSDSSSSLFEQTDSFGAKNKLLHRDTRERLVLDLLEPPRLVRGVKISHGDSSWRILRLAI